MDAFIRHFIVWLGLAAGGATYTYLTHDISWACYARDCYFTGTGVFSIWLINNILWKEG